MEQNREPTNRKRIRLSSADERAGKREVQGFQTLGGKCDGCAVKVGVLTLRDLPWRATVTRLGARPSNAAEVSRGHSSRQEVLDGEGLNASR